MIFDKEAWTIKWRNNLFFSTKTMLKNMPLQKSNLDPDLIPSTKTKSVWTIKLKVNVKLSDS